MELKPGFRARGGCNLVPRALFPCFGFGQGKAPWGRGLGAGGGSLLIRWRIRGGYA